MVFCAFLSTACERAHWLLSLLMKASDSFRQRFMLTLTDCLEGNISTGEIRGPCLFVFIIRLNPLVECPVFTKSDFYKDEAVLLTIIIILKWSLVLSKTLPSAATRRRSIGKSWVRCVECTVVTNTYTVFLGMGWIQKRIIFNLVSAVNATGPMHMRQRGGGL